MAARLPLGLDDPAPPIPGAGDRQVDVDVVGAAGVGAPVASQPCWASAELGWRGQTGWTLASGADAHRGAAALYRAQIGVTPRRHGWTSLELSGVVELGGPRAAVAPAPPRPLIARRGSARGAAARTGDRGGEMWWTPAAVAGPAVDVAFAPRWSTRREELYSALAYDVGAYGGRIGFTAPAGRWEVAAALDVATGSGRSGPSFSFDADGETLETPPSSFSEVRLSEITSYRLPIRFPLAVGVGPSADVSIGSYSFGRGGVFTYYGAIGLDAAARVEVPVPGTSRLIVSVSAPIAAWVSRSPYALNDDEYIETIREGGGVGAVFALLGRGSLQSWDRRAAGRASATWTLDGPGIKPIVSLDASAERHAAENGEALVRTSLGIAAGARFGGARP